MLGALDWNHLLTEKKLMEMSTIVRKLVDRYHE